MKNLKLTVYRIPTLCIQCYPITMAATMAPRWGSMESRWVSRAGEANKTKGRGKGAMEELGLRIPSGNGGLWWRAGRQARRIKGRRGRQKRIGPANLFHGSHAVPPRHRPHPTRRLHISSTFGVGFGFAFVLRNESNTGLRVCLCV